MNAVVCFSLSGQSKRIATYFSQALSWTLFDLTNLHEQDNFAWGQVFDCLIISFPVHSQNLPRFVKKFLTNVKASAFLLIATYGKMGPGNILHEAYKLCDKKVLGGAYIPTRHSYIDNGEFVDFQILDILIKRVKEDNRSFIVIPRHKKHVFASFFPNLRSRLGVKMIKNDRCNSCNQCREVCPVGVIDKGIINSSCIRCLRCSHFCPHQAITVRYSFFLKRYLKKNREERIIVY